MSSGIERDDGTVAEVHQEKAVLAHVFLSCDDWTFSTGHLFRRRRRHERRLSWELHFTDPGRLSEAGLLDDHAVAALGAATFRYRGSDAHLRWLSQEEGERLRCDLGLPKPPGTPGEHRDQAGRPGESHLPN